MVRIKIIEFEIGKKIISLTEEEARNLKCKLDSLFGGSDKYIPYPIYPAPHYGQWSYTSDRILEEDPQFLEQNLTVSFR